MICFIALGAYTAWRTHNGSTDFDTFYYAAKRVAAGEPLYTETKGISPYIYPPFFACLLTPLTVFNLEIASFFWYALSLLLFAVSIVLAAILIFGHTGIKQTWKSASHLLPKIMFLILAGAIFIDNISLLQSNILLFFAVTASLYYFKKGRPVFGGMLLGLAISIKLLPALFLAYFIVKRELKMAASCLAWIAVFTLILPSLFLGPQNTLYSLKTWNKNMLSKSTSSVPNNAMMGGMFNPVNQSITASLSRWLIKDDADILFWKTNCYKKYPRFLVNVHGSLSRERVLIISYTIEYLLVAITLFYCLRRKKDSKDAVSNNELSLVFLASLFLDPFLKTPHLIFMVFPALFLVSRIKSVGRYNRFLYFSFCSAVILYLSLGLKVFRIFGFGTISLVILWLMVLTCEKDRACLELRH